MKIGIYGGTFNPIHKGHIHFAKTALKELSLDKIILIPDNIPPHKMSDSIADSKDRFNMCCIAVRNEKQLEISDIEINREGISYSIDTLRELKKQYPKDEFFLLMGTDMFLSLDKWKCYKEIMSLSTAVGAPRKNCDLEKLKAKASMFLKENLKCMVLPLKPIETSSTMIRNGTDDELDEEVLSYIEQNGLYGCSTRFSINFDYIKKQVEQTLSAKRYIHSINVANEAITLGKNFNCDLNLCYLAGLLHDFCKEMSYDEMLKILQGTDIIKDRAFLASPKVWHGYAAAYYIPERFKIYSVPILDSICYHSTAKANMSLLCKIIYMADLLSEERDYSGVEQLREKTHRNLDEGLKEALIFSITKLSNDGRPLLSSTVDAYNETVLKEE